MVSYDLRKLQLIQLEMLKDIKKICIENDIKYFIVYGTLLGAIRHKGFIPWDDDIDIAMLSDDYNRFLEICKTNLPEKYFLQNDKTDLEYPRIWSKIRINNTCNMEREYRRLHIHYGIDMDVFELIPFSDNPILFFIQKRAAHVYRLLKFEKAHNAIDDRLKRKRDTIIYKMIPKMIKKRLLNISKKMVYLSSHKRTRRIVEISEILILERQWFDENMSFEFEGEKFSGPNQYEKFLSYYYGNYMELPPKNQRNGHGDRIVDFDNSFENYMA